MPLVDPVPPPGIAVKESCGLARLKFIYAAPLSDIAGAFALKNRFFSIYLSRGNLSNNLNSININKLF